MSAENDPGRGAGGESPGGERPDEEFDFTDVAPESAPEPSPGGADEPPRHRSDASLRSEARATRRGVRDESPNMLPAREVRRSVFERLLVRIIATAGIVGIGVVIAAILASSKTQGWIIGLAVSIVSVVLSAVLWSSREL
jgi:hypothetical protein